MDNTTTIKVKELNLDLASVVLDLGAMAALEELDEAKYGNAFEFLQSFAEKAKVGKNPSVRDIQALLWMCTYSQHEGKISPRDIKADLKMLPAVAQVIAAVTPGKKTKAS